MGPVPSSAIALLGLAATIGVFAYVYRDATRVEMGRPRLWAAIAAGSVAIGFGLYLFVPAAPMTGVILTANTGPVLYTFEREIATEDDDPPEPGQLPHQK
ncbi:hypothetical protein ACFO5R_15110 [Halosolutus amylolyticus]|uniref:Uncharacterized protein n=1 Tax=Halosolutus amylolyticus TaxID=2932267 RepID=A0ABD5PS43_9EURY|nr:hypothetical protein [Halosolutus amylolyticus]